MNYHDIWIKKLKPQSKPFYIALFYFIIMETTNTLLTGPNWHGNIYRTSSTNSNLQSDLAASFLCFMCSVANPTLVSFFVFLLASVELILCK